ncbi:MAG TPA: carboxypeptidase regulatory-like domain-containing protein [Longimicrobiales bacterium]|nr:carboxypeptidase regulatory-like domain-containing protein [Longimicrobiales bacterium]
MKWPPTVCLLIACASLTPAPLYSQTALLIGRTLDYNTEMPIAGARVEIVDDRGRRVASAMSDSAGTFRFSRVDAGSYQLRAGSAGYKEVLTPPVELADSGTVVVVVRLAVDVIPLAPLEVTARPAPLHRNVALAAFLERVERSMGGTFIMPDEIGLRSPRYVTDLLATTAGFMVVADALVNQRAQCAPSVYLDGTRLNNQPKTSSTATREAFEVANLIPPSELAGIEVYRGAATVPGEFSGSNAACGVILLWTNRG